MLLLLLLLLLLRGQGVGGRGVELVVGLVDDVVVVAFGRSVSGTAAGAARRLLDAAANLMPELQQD